MISGRLSKNYDVGKWVDMDRISRRMYESSFQESSVLVRRASSNKMASRLRTYLGVLPTLRSRLVERYKDMQTHCMDLCIDIPKGTVDYILQSLRPLHCNIEVLVTTRPIKITST